MTANLFFSAIGLAGAAVALVHVKVKTSSVLVHHATHEKLFENRKVNRLAAEALSILALTQPFSDYKKTHQIHHSKKFAGVGDEEAMSLYNLGFRPGVERKQLWKAFVKTLLSPRFHAESTWHRLRKNFLQGPRWRIAAAWGLWALMITAATMAQVLPGLIIGILMPLMIGGNVGSFLELVSRHRWLVTTDSDKRRQFELSHGRFLAPPLPEVGAAAGTWVAWCARVGISTLARLTVTPSDLTWHIAHHIGLKKPEHMQVPAWADAALAHSDQLRNDDALARQSYWSIFATIDAWFQSLENELPHS